MDGYRRQWSLMIANIKLVTKYVIFIGGVIPEENDIIVVCASQQYICY